MQKGRSVISDDAFFLSGSTNDSHAELLATLAEFRRDQGLGDHHGRCRFPARYLWLKHELGWDDDTFPQPACSDYNEFRSKAPASNVSLVFVSENVTAPSSMLGHAFLKLSGTTPDGRLAEHAVTFFTILDSLNIPKIVYQNIAGGMNGYFALQPYSKMKENYLEAEKRNLWEYELNLSDYHKALLQAHVWELKGIQQDYLFLHNNCATLTNFFLTLVAPEMAEENIEWVSPVDTVKQVQHYQLVKQTNIVTSDVWKIQMLLEQTDQLTPDFRTSVLNTAPAEQDSFIASLSAREKVLAATYLHYLRKRAGNPATAFETRLIKSTQDYVLDYSHYKDPVKAPGNNQLQLSAGKDGDRNFVGLSFLPASNRITDDQRQFFSLTELKIAEVDLRLYETGTAELNSLTLYSMKSFSPWNSFTRNMSGQWQTGLQNHRDNQLAPRLVYDLSGGLGYTFLLSPDILTYASYNIGAAFDRQTAYAYHYPEAGLEVKEIWNMKSSLVYQAKIHEYNAATVLHKIRGCQSFFPEQDTTLLACFNSDRNLNGHRNGYSFSYQAHF